jgi:hypothetical protein
MSVLPRPLIVLLSLTCVVILAAGLSAAQAVIAPVVFALFAIALVWPLQGALQKRIPAVAALLVTMLVTLVTLLGLALLVAWAFGRVGSHVVANAAQIQAFYTAQLAWAEARGIDVAAEAVGNQVIRHGDKLTVHWLAEWGVQPAAGGWAQLAGSGSVLRRSAIAEVGVPRGRRRSVELRLSARLHRARLRVVAPAGPVLVSSHPIDTARAVGWERRRETAAAIRLLISRDGPLGLGRRPRGARVAALASSLRPLAGLRRAAFLAVLVALGRRSKMPAI